MDDSDCAVLSIRQDGSTCQVGKAASTRDGNRHMGGNNHLQHLEGHLLETMGARPQNGQTSDLQGCLAMADQEGSQSQERDVDKDPCVPSGFRARGRTRWCGLDYTNSEVPQHGSEWPEARARLCGRHTMQDGGSGQARGKTGSTRGQSKGLPAASDAGQGGVVGIAVHRRI